jgi:hypothetical protein
MKLPRCLKRPSCLAGRPIWWLILAVGLAGTGCRNPRTGDSASTGETSDDTNHPPDSGVWSDWSDQDFGWPVLGQGDMNLMLVYDVALDAARRSAFAIGLDTDTIVEIDLDEGRIRRYYDLDGHRLGLPSLAVDGHGVLWGVGATRKPAIRLDPVSGTYDLEDMGSLILTEARGLPAGGIVASAHTSSESHLIRLDEGGAVAKDEVMPGVVTGLSLLDGGEQVAASMYLDDDDTPLAIVDAQSLKTVQTCDAPIFANHLARMADGRFFLAQSGSLATIDCESGDQSTIVVGTDNKDVFSIAGDGLVLDRLGGVDVYGTGGGAARTFSPSLVQVGSDLPIGRFSGFGEIDSNTGLLWMNSEGTSEVLAMDTTTGEMVHRVRVGTHVEGVAVDVQAGVVYYTGRLSGTVGRLDMSNGVFVESADRSVGWPRSPVLSGGTLWILDQLSMRIHGFDPRELTVTRTIDTGLPANHTLVFDQMAVHPGRGTLFVTQAETGLLAEVDPVAGKTVRTWNLPGRKATGPAQTGALELVLYDDAAFTFDTLAGTLTRVSLSDGRISSSTLSPALLEDLVYAVLPLLPFGPADESVLYVGGHAFDPRTLLEIPDKARDVTRFFGETEDGRWLGWRQAGNEAVALDSDGNVLQTVPLEESASGDPAPVLVPQWGNRLVYTRLDEGEIRAVPLPD